MLKHWNIEIGAAGLGVFKNLIILTKICQTSVVGTVCAKSVLILGAWGIPWEIDGYTLETAKKQKKFLWSPVQNTFDQSFCQEWHKCFLATILW